MANGSEVEDADGGDLVAMLPGALTSVTPWAEWERFTFEPGRPGRLVSYHGGALDEVAGAVGARGAFAEAHLKTPAVRRAGLAERAAASVAFANGVLRPLGVREGERRYLVTVYRATAISEERREAVLAVAAGARNGCRLDELAPLVLERLDEATALPGYMSQLADTADVLRLRPVLDAAAAELAPALFADLRKSLGRRLARDLERLSEYYGSIEEEIGRKVERRQLAGEERERELARAAATRLERDRKLLDQKARYTMSVELVPLATLRVILDVALIDALALRRKASREVELVYNTLIKDFEPVPCEGCLLPLRRLLLCDTKVHMTCRPCAGCERCGKARCRACGPPACGCGS